MIILEGPDGTGKSTLAQYIATQFNLTHAQIGAAPPSSLILSYCRLCERRLSMPFVQDRVTQISEYVYSQVFPRQHDVFESVLRDFIHRIILRKPIVIYCRVEDLSKVRHTASDPTDTPERINRINENMPLVRSAYDKLLWTDAFNTPRFMTYDYFTTDMEIVYEHVSKNLQ